MSYAKLNQARRLRRNQTETEKIFWSRVRNRQLEGFKFKRQYPIGHFVVDFLCFEARLVIELDGGQHDERRAADLNRTQKIEAVGYRVVRFWNNDVNENIEAVLNSVLNAIKAAPR